MLELKLSQLQGGLCASFCKPFHALGSSWLGDFKPREALKSTTKFYGIGLYPSRFRRLSPQLEFVLGADQDADLDKINKFIVCR